jgi:hypothetical protein
MVTWHFHMSPNLPKKFSNVAQSETLLNGDMAKLMNSIQVTNPFFFFFGSVRDNVAS